MKMTQCSEWVQKELPLAQPLGDYEVRYTAFPFSLFSLPMSSARAQPGLSSSPPASRLLPGGGKNSSPSPCLGKVDLGNQTADVHPQLEPGTHRARSFTTLLLALILQSCLVNTSSLQISMLAPAFTATVLVVGGFSAISETHLLYRATQQLLKPECCWAIC